MTVTLNLPPEIEQAYLAEAHAKGVPVDVVLRDILVARQPNRPEGEVIDASISTGAALVAAMQASPYKEISLEPSRYRLPVRDVTF